MTKDDAVIKIQVPNLSIQQISESGQCFRMNRLDEKRYCLTAFGNYLEMEQTEEELTLFCSREEYDSIWRQYFDIDRDYGSCIAAVCGEDTYLARAADFGSGIRILRQDVWEMVISFIISQQNNIRRIRKCIETLCANYGERRYRELPHGIRSYDTFPGAEALARATEEELRGCNLGYRSRYIVNTSRSIVNGEVDLEALRSMEYGQAREELLKVSGVGGKVADCICLFGLHHLDAFPVDTHIRQVLDAQYPAGFPFEKYAGYAGIMQQYIFYYDLMWKKA